MGASIWRVGANSRRYLGRRMWRTGWGQVSGEWGRTADDILGEGCGGLDGSKYLESGGEQQKISWEKDVEDWMGASVWRVGANCRRYLGRRMWRTGWEQVSGEWGRTAEDILGEGCGGLDGGKYLESGANSRRYLGRRMWRTVWGQVSGEWEEQQKISWEKDVEDWLGVSIWRVGRTAEDRRRYTEYIHMRQ